MLASVLFLNSINLNFNQSENCGISGLIELVLYFMWTQKTNDKAAHLLTILTNKAYLTLSVDIRRVKIN